MTRTPKVEGIPDHRHGLVRDRAGALGTLEERLPHQAPVARVAHATLADRVKEAVEGVVRQFENPTRVERAAS